MPLDLSPELLESVLTVEDVERFNNDGVIKLKNILSQEIINSLRSAVNKQFTSWQDSTTAYDFQSLAEQMWRGDDSFSYNNADRFDMDFYHQIVKEDSTARPLMDAPQNANAPKGKFFYEAAGWRSYQEIREAAMDSTLPEIAARLLDSSYINFWEDTTFIKSANAYQRTAFHQDKAYFQISGDKCCIFWIPLDSATRETGTMEYVVGSHQWDQEYAPNVFFTQTPFPHSDAGKLPDIEGNRDQYDIRTIEAEPGDVIIHHVLTIHGAGGNVSPDKDRRAISFRYCGDDIRYWDRPGALTQVGLKTKLENGQPLYSADYPRVFPRPYPGASLSRLYGH